MATKPLTTRTALAKIEDLTYCTSDRRYPLGLVVEIEDSDFKAVKKFMYIKAHAALTAYVPYAIDFTATDANEVATKAPVEIAANGALIGVPQYAFTANYYGFVQIQGHTEANCGTTTATHALQVVANAPTVFTSEAGTTISVDTCALAVDTGGTPSTIYLLGVTACIAAS